MSELPPLGITSGISSKDYHDSPGISKSGLDHMERSPLHYWHHKNNPEEPTTAMRIGSAFHTLVLEPEKFKEEIVIIPKIDRRSAAGKAAYTAIQQSGEGKTLISQAELENIQKMRDAVFYNAAAAKILAKGVAEQSIYHIHEDLNVLCKCRPDWLIDMGDTWVVVDLKSTTNAHPEDWAKSAYNFRYHVQSGFYTDLIEGCTNKPVSSFMFIVCEKDPPYGTAIYHSTSHFVNQGRIDYLHNLRTYKFCLENEKKAKEEGRKYEWPGYGDYIQNINLPGWAK